MNYWRDILYNKKLIGAYPDGVGFGNLSSRVSENQFFITGTTTGHLSQLTERQYTLVTQYDFSRNSLSCIGPIRASSESLSHAACYESDPTIGAVIHIHSIELWEKWLNKIPTTPCDVEYGTPEMAYAIRGLCCLARNTGERILVMGGHREGILAFGETMDAAGESILKLQ
jgi:L-ribulose-5-phosphate 4-epimerase